MITETKFFELRDIGTFIPIMVTKILYVKSSLAANWLAYRAGYGPERPYYFLQRINGGSGQGSSDRYFWSDRTFQTAHGYIEANWDNLPDGAVVDVEFILGETQVPKKSERCL